ncbi:hypothetical protein CR161_08695 [Prosthecochloris sp. ZM]|uniref:DUF4282 domain-containing protein n=1 Tax=Prosthecochloris sp. ZM TaxID=2283143 RepID=UPI000DF73A8D|nr:DUF4282 domain-containing protein [Prosthecochloris sp. ZM]RDD30775.1 hypothetical protein CR161_08695 [Prosthecochloris sp. ZM]
MDAHGFFGKLFDFSFKEFVTLQIVRYLYVLAIILSAISALSMIVSGFSTMQYSFLGGLVKIVGSPVSFVLMVLFARVVLEALVATFRIAENTTLMVEKNSREQERGS